MTGYICLDSLSDGFPAHIYLRSHCMGNLIWTLVIGFVVGLVARALKPGEDKLGILMTSLLGVVGAFAASFIGQTMGWYKDGEPAGFIAAVVGAMLVLFLYGVLKKK